MVLFACQGCRNGCGNGGNQLTVVIGCSRYNLGRLFCGSCDLGNGGCQCLLLGSSLLRDIVQPAEIAPVADEDEGEIVAAITAAIAAMLQSEEYKGQFESGFRVVSFTRKGGAWNKEN